MTEWTTRIRGYHVVLFEPHDDRGGTRNVVVLNIPETPLNEVSACLSQARRWRARVAVVCDTAQQAKSITAIVEEAYQTTAGSPWNEPSVVDGGRHFNENATDPSRATRAQRAGAALPHHQRRRGACARGKSRPRSARPFPTEKGEEAPSPSALLCRYALEGLRFGRATSNAGVSP